jgi:hypothetical protein
MLHHVALVRSDVSEERSSSIIRVTKIGQLGTTVASCSYVSTERGNESSGSIKCLGIIERMFNWWPIEKQILMKTSNLT